MSDRIRQLLTTALVAIVAGGLAGVTSAAIAQDTSTADEGAYEVAGLNADSVDGRHAIGATGNKALRAYKLVATNRYGRLPSNIIRPRWRELKGVPAGFKDGVDDVGVSGIALTAAYSAVSTLLPDTEDTVIAHCPAGSRVVGGGFDNGEAMVISTGSTNAGTAWYAYAANFGSSSKYLQAHAICMTVTPGWRLTDRR